MFPLYYERVLNASFFYLTLMYMRSVHNYVFRVKRWALVKSIVGGVDRQPASCFLVSVCLFISLWGIWCRYRLYNENLLLYWGKIFAQSMQGADCAVWSMLNKIIGEHLALWEPGWRMLLILHKISLWQTWIVPGALDRVIIGRTLCILMSPSWSRVHIHIWALLHTHTYKSDLFSFFR